MSERKIGVHYCRCSNGVGHGHLLTGGKTPSWPFWSLEMGMEMLEFSRDNMGVEEATFNLLKVELEKLALKPRDPKSGCFQKPLLPRWDIGDIDKAHLAWAWSQFFTGKSETMNYVVEWATVGKGGYFPGPFVLPLECSFVKRPEGEVLEVLTGPNASRVYQATPVEL